MEALQHEALLAGGELRFEMQAEPNTTWGTQPSARPLTTSPSGG